MFGVRVGLAVAAQLRIAADLLGRQKAGLLQMRLQVRSAQRSLQLADSLRVGGKLGSIYLAGRKGEIKLTLGLNELSAQRTCLSLVLGQELFGGQPLRRTEFELLSQFKGVHGARVAIELGCLGLLHALAGQQILGLRR